MASKFYLDEANNLLAEYMEVNEIEPFPWVTQNSLDNKVYVVSVEFVDYDVEKEAYMVKIDIIEENSETGESVTHSKEEECFEADFDTFVNDLFEGLKESGFYPNDANSNFELDIYSWVEDSDSERTTDDIFTFIVNKCREAKNLYAEEDKRIAYIQEFTKKDEDDEY